MHMKFFSKVYCDRVYFFVHRAHCDRGQVFDPQRHPPPPPPPTPPSTWKSSAPPPLDPPLINDSMPSKQGQNTNIEKNLSICFLCERAERASLEFCCIFTFKKCWRIWPIFRIAVKADRQRVLIMCTRRQMLIHHNPNISNFRLWCDILVWESYNDWNGRRKFRHEFGRQIENLCFAISFNIVLVLHNLCRLTCTDKTSKKALLGEGGNCPPCAPPPPPPLGYASESIVAFGVILFTVAQR